MIKKSQRQKAKSKLTDAERHERFVEMAREVEGDERPEAFDRAFKRLTKPQKASGKKTYTQV